MTDKYAGDMPDHLFRALSPAEQERFRAHIRAIWQPDHTPEGFGVWHPVSRDEWRKLDEEAGR